MRKETNMGEMAATITLTDGRRLAFEEEGDPDGWPVLFFHGTPGSRRYRHPDPGPLDRLGVRLIRFDRSGYGQSSPVRHAGLAGAAEDAAALVDVLGLDDLAVVGVSGGAPHALAAAARLGHRVRAAGLISAIGPLDGWADTRGMNTSNRWGLRLARSAPALLRLALQPMARQAASDPEAALDGAGEGFAAPDQAAMRRPDVRAMYLEDIAASYRQGTAGQVEDLRLVARDWGFGLAAVTAPATLWHGAEDRNVPLHLARRLAERLPSSARFEVVPEAGHLLIFDRWEEVLSRLRDDAAARTVPPSGGAGGAR